MKAKKILVIDDDEMNLQIAKMILERKLACKVLTADNGLDGTEILRSQRLNLVLLDVMRPDFDGIETLMEIRNDAWIKDVPVMMLTASGDIEVIQKVGVLGVKDYIKKPFMPADLIARVEKKLTEEPPSTEVLLIGDDKEILQEMKTIIEENFNHEALIATNHEEISAVNEVSLIISYADMKFVDGVKFLAFAASEKKFEHVPFVLTTADKLIELFNALNSLENDTAPDTDSISVDISPAQEKIPEESSPKEIAEPVALTEIQKSTVIHDEKKRLAKVVTNFIGYELDIHV